MCLHYIDTFEEQTSFGSILAQIESILDVVYTASLNQKTAKAIRHKKSSIAKQFYRLEKKNGGITRHPKFKEILEKIRLSLGTPVPISALLITSNIRLVIIATFIASLIS